MVKPAATIIHIFGLFVSAVGVKKILDQLFPSIVIYVSAVIQVSGILLYSNPAAPEKLSLFADKSLQIFLKNIYLPLVTAQILTNRQTDESMTLTYFAASLLLSIVSNILQKTLNYVVIAQLSVALYLCFIDQFHDESYWLVNFLVLFLINHFALPKLAARYSVPHVDLSAISLVFLNIFLINSFS